jgi:xanthine/CO dehydrogenase XdhC/CoxF family maturation factor
MNSRHLVDRFAACRERGEAIVLVTVYETVGSTYSKAGARMLITAGGESQGLVSGGCLEGDLAERARRVLATGRAATVTYDLRDEADELFGLGIGCNGLISVLLQPVDGESGYEPLTSIAEALLGRARAAVATVIDSDIDEIQSAATLTLIGDEARARHVPPELESTLVAGCRNAALLRQASLVAEPRGFRVLYAPLSPVPRVLILGAGLDAVPLVNVLAELGWRVSIADHRPAYLERSGLGRAESKLAVGAATLRADLAAGGSAIGDFDAIVVMSHHLATDREYLRQLAQVDVAYLGLLGPPARRRRLLETLGDESGQLAARLRGPVGIDIGADSAESIAVSIAAEIQQVLIRVV